MLYAIHRGKVEAYTAGQDQVLHLMTSVEAVAAIGLDYCFTDGHADMAFSEFFLNLADLQRIDWKIMKDTYWSDTEVDRDRKRKRQAEFLVHQFFPWTLISKIGVMDVVMAEQTKEVIARCEHQPTIVVERQWYY